MSSLVLGYITALLSISRTLTTYLNNDTADIYLAVIEAFTQIQQHFYLFTMSELPISIPRPLTLQEWRKCGWEPKGAQPRDVWTPLEEFFLGEGLTLWKMSGIRLNVIPPNDNPRRQDAFAYSTRYQATSPRVPLFGLVKAIHCPARTTDDQDVLIRLVAKGDEGSRHVKVLRRLAVGPTALIPENHVVPILQEIELDDMNFIVTPLMSEGFEHPWHYNFGEVVDAVHQVLEGIKFCHDRLVAHLDLDVDNILLSFVGGSCQDPGVYATPFSSPFREYFPVRYYINDFELAVCFEEDSDPSTRVVKGTPLEGVLRGQYGRESAPEMLLDKPYCPFRTDVWQLGRIFKQTFGHLEDLSGPLLELYTDMMNDDPSLRPTASEAFERVHEFRKSLSPELLQTRVIRPPEPPSRDTDE